MSTPRQLPPEYVSHLAKQGFVLTEVLGQGLCGSVYLAEQRSLNRKVAVKFFDSAFVRSDERMHKRFVREAKLLARFQHPNIPYVLTEGAVSTDFGVAPYFVMEHVHGKTLRDLLHEKVKLEPTMAVDIAVQVLDALSYAHAHKIVHRDVKPSNVMIDGRQRCFLIDFSIGVSFDSRPGETRATMHGEMLGSPPYCSSEQLTDASNVDGRTDIYSVGVMLMEMLSGRTDLTNVGRTLSTLPRSLIEGIEKACATDKAARYKNAEEFARAIRGRSQIGAPSLSPALAICSNLKCPDANWSSRGYYRGPRVLKDSTESYCTSCGTSLDYQCKNCGGPISETPFCGSCGAEGYRIPECVKCGSWLTKEFMDTQGKDGCAKCKPKRPGPAPRLGRTVLQGDDDIPF